MLPIAIIRVLCQGWQRFHVRMRVADPEHHVLKSALRTALACAICMAIFQWWQDTHVAVLAAFAAFTFVQNDPQGMFWPRLLFLSSIIVSFTALALVGFLWGDHSVVYLLFLPVLSFACGYLAYLGSAYFYAGIWALVLYVFAAANAVPVAQVNNMVNVFLISGAVCIVTCFVVFPIRPYASLLKNYQAIFKNFMAVVATYRLTESQRTRKLNQHIDQLLFLHQKNLHLYFKRCGVSLAQQKDFKQLAKCLYQLGLLLKSSLTSQQKIEAYSSYSHTPLKDCETSILAWLKAMLDQIQGGTPPDFPAMEAELEQWRDGLTAFRRKALEEAKLRQQAVDFSAIFDYSNYFYQLIQLQQLLRDTSDNLVALAKLRPV